MNHQHSSSTESAAGSRVKAAAARLHELVLEHLGEDPFIGSEADLVSRLGVSRPTLHQAARLLEHEELLTIRRGVGGGYFARVPSEDTVARAISAFLRSRRVDMYAVAQTAAPLLLEAAEAVAAIVDDRKRREVRNFVIKNGGIQPESEPNVYAAVVVAFERLVADLSGNPVLSLLVSVLGHLALSPEGGGFRLNMEQAGAYAQHLDELSEAVASGNVERASRLVGENNRRVLGWLRPHRSVGADLVLAPVPTRKLRRKKRSG
jgi:DNA-binding FadR family transcriptional regulator